MKNKRVLAALLVMVLGTSPLQVQAGSVSGNDFIEKVDIVDNLEQEETDIKDSQEQKTENEIVDTEVPVGEVIEEPARPDDLMFGDYIESNLDYNTPVYIPGYEIYSELPTAFPDNLDAYPSARNQNPYGTCWAFASLGLAEFDLINDGSANGSIDLSELQLAYFTFNSVIDPLGGTEGDTAKYYNENAQNTYLNYGGNYAMASRRLAQWYGPVDEKKVPYGQAVSTISGGLDESYAYDQTMAHLENAYMINIKKNPGDVKRQIMEHGAAGIMYYHDNLSFGWNSTLGRYTYYDTALTGGGHAVMVVGWDDNFSKDNFTGTSKPSGDGAWLIRNSWGTYANYFWMSYETASLSDTAWIFDFSAEDGYDNNYQLDGGVDAYPDRSHLTLANVFKTKQEEGVSAETLSAVSLSFTQAASVNYTIEIYTELKDETNPLSGTKQESATTEGTTAYAGIYTIPLDDDVTLRPGSSFAVVVKVDAPVLDYEQAMTVATGENLSTVVWDCKVSMNNYKSFYYSGGKFYAFPWGNYCVKAFTTDIKGDGSQEVTDGLHEKNGKLYYFKNGVIDTGYTGAALYQDVIYYCENGKVTFNYTGFGEYENRWYYFEGSTVAKGKEDIIYNTTVGEWWYVKDGEFQSDAETIAHNAYGWWYVKNGVIDFTYTGAAENANGIFYCENGTITFAYTGFGKYKDHWYYFENSVVARGKEDVIYNKNKEEWWYVKDGEFQSDAETIARNAYGWWYVKNGVIDFTYTGAAENANGIFYCENGTITFTYTGFGEYKSKIYYFESSSIAISTTGALYNKEKGWIYVKKGVFDSTYTGFAENGDSTWYFENGVVAESMTGLYLMDEKYVCLQKGKVDTAATGFYEVSGHYYYLKNGKQTSVESVVYNPDAGEWWYVKDGEFQSDAETIAHNAYGWWYVKNGVIDFTYTGAAENANGIFYCENGTITFAYTGFGKYKDHWYYFENSVVARGKEDVIYNKNKEEWWYVKDGEFQSDAETIARNAYGWWYVKNGVIDFTYTGAAENANGIFYCENGTITFTYTGFGKYKDKWYYFENSAVARGKEDVIYNKNTEEWWYVKDGEFQSEAETIAQNAYGWWYVKNGVIDFAYIGAAENANGIFYCENGTITFTYTGFAEYKSQWYYFSNSIAVRKCSVDEIQ